MRDDYPYKAIGEPITDLDSLVQTGVLYEIKCPKCGGKILKRTSKKGYVFYACERGTDCGFITWEVPTKDFCPACGKTLFKHSGRGPLKSFCINEECMNFVPEDKRTYKKKTAEEKAETKNAKKPAAKKTASKKSAKE